MAPIVSGFLRSRREKAKTKKAKKKKDSSDTNSNKDEKTSDGWVIFFSFKGQSYKFNGKIFYLIFGIYKDFSD